MKDRKTYPMRWCVWLLATGLILLPTRFAAAADDPEWKVGLAHVKITPERPVMMAGYASRTKPFEKVATDLYAKALVLEDPRGRRGRLPTSSALTS